MKTKKIIVAMVVLCALLLMTACNFSASDVAGITFKVAPHATYAQNAEVDIAAFKVEVSLKSGETIEFDLGNSALTVQGTNGDYLDTRTVGTHTIIVTYQTVKCEFTYNVTGDVETKTLISAADTTTDAFKLYDYLKNGNGTAPATVDLTAYEWEPIALTGTKTLSDVTITGLNSTSTGLFSTVTGTLTVTNVIFNNATISSEGKEVAVIAGNVAGTLTVDNVEINGSVLSGLSCVAGVVGRTSPDSDITINDVEVKNSTFSAFNPVTVAIADGEGDKVAAIAGQLQNGGSISNCVVTNVTITGTRCLGGLIGYHAKGGEITGNTINNDVIVAASVNGGMLLSKGTRNVGGLIGTLACTAANTLTITANNVLTQQLLTNAAYEQSSSGKFVGGLRGTLAASAFNVTLASGTIAYTQVDGHAWTTFEGYVAYQTAALALINA